MAGLTAWFVEDGDRRTVLQTPAATWWVQGLLLVFLVPPLLMFLMTLLAFAQGGGDPVAYLVFDGLAVLLSVPSALGGVWQLVRARPRSAASRVTLDWTARTLTAAGEPPLPLDQVTGLRVRQPNPILKWRVLEATLVTGEPVALAQRLTPRRYAAVRQTANALAARLAVPVTLPADVQSGDLVGLSDKHAAAFCYLPLQGIFLFASVWYLFQARDRPFVRFAAIQSLLQVAMSTAVLVALLLASFGTVWARTELGLPEVAQIGLLVPMWCLFLAWHVGSRVVATIQAARGRPVVLPWLWPFVARLRPEPLAG